MNILIDGLFFQLQQSGIARLWRSLLEELALRNRSNILLLDRGGAPEIAGISRLPFPSYNFANTATDSCLIEKFCAAFSVDVFASTYYTTPLNTPSVMIAYDFIPELFGFNLSDRGWQEKRLAILHAAEILCISRQTKEDLISYYPEVSAEAAHVAYPGIDRNVFDVAGRQSQELAAAELRFRRLVGLGEGRQYFLMVGSRMQHRGYKNCRIFFEAITELTSGDFDIVCVGGDSKIESEFMELLPSWCSAYRIDLTDELLATAYQRAIALVYPSLYEGFGLPVAEAMACGCPVITTTRGSLPEVAGDAAIFVSGTDRTEILHAIEAVRRPNARADLIKRGIRQSQKFSWNNMAEAFEDAASRASLMPQDERALEWLAAWKTIRLLQTRVDTVVPGN